MYTRSEVEKKMGVTRQTLRGYEDIGLLPPTEIAPNGQWMYDDLALHQLSVILIFTEAGYTRKKIKEILDNPKTIFSEMESAIGILEDKKKHIEGCITTLQCFVKVKDMPEETIRLVEKTFDLASITEEKNFSELLGGLIKDASQLRDGERKAMLEYELFLTHFGVLAQIKDLPPDTPEIQAEVGALLADYMNMIKTEMIESGELENPEERAEYEKYFTLELVGGGIAETLLELFNEEDSEPSSKTLKAIYGEENIKLIIRALEVYAENHPMEEELLIENEKEDIY